MSSATATNATIIDAPVKNSIKTLPEKFAKFIRFGFFISQRFYNNPNDNINDNVNDTDHGPDAFLQHLHLFDTCDKQIELVQHFFDDYKNIKVGMRKTISARYKPIKIKTNKKTAAIAAANDHALKIDKKRKYNKKNTINTNDDFIDTIVNAARSKSHTEPAADVVTEPAIEPAAEPAIEPAAEPAIEPAAEPAIEPAIEPVVVVQKPRTKTVKKIKPADVVVDPAADVVVDPAADVVAEPDIEPAIEPVVVVQKPRTKTVKKIKPADVVVDPAADVVVDPAADVVTEPAIEPVVVVQKPRTKTVKKIKPADVVVDPAADVVVDPAADVVVVKKSKNKSLPKIKPISTELTTEPHSKIFKTKAINLVLSTFNSYTDTLPTSSTYTMPTTTHNDTMPSTCDDTMPTSYTYTMPTTTHNDTIPTCDDDPDEFETVDTELTTFSFQGQSFLADPDHFLYHPDTHIYIGRFDPLNNIILL